MVVINEIVYGVALVPGTNDSIELYNAGTETVDLTGCHSMMTRIARARRT